MSEPMTEERLEIHRRASQMFNGQFGASGVSEARELVAEIERLRSVEQRLTATIDVCIAYANCVINGHSSSCNREMWSLMRRRLGDAVRELPDNETYEHPEPPTPSSAAYRTPAERRAEMSAGGDR